MRLQFVGGASTVTGSCYYMEVNRLKLLVDCGMHQGGGAGDLDRNGFPFDPRGIDFVFLTHAHIDHCGRLPRLVKEGFRGRILATSAAIDLTKPMLFDSANIQMNDAEWLTKKALRAGREPVEPLYTDKDVENTMPLFEAREYGKLNHLGGGVKYRFIDAGHILGSATLEIWFQDSEREKKIVFSGDIGQKGNPIVNDPSRPDGADYVVMETTYGGRLHRPLKESIDELAGAVKTTFKRGGNVYIPSFALGRTQDILYILNDLVRTGRLYNINVHLDSPLAQEATKIYVAHPEFFDDEAKRLFAGMGEGGAIKLHYVQTVEDSMRLNRLKSGHIIIAGSGMCEGGRIRHHLKHNIWRQECSIVFVGYQASGTLGRRIVDGAGRVDILGEEVVVRARIHTINGLSAHADQAGLLEWLAAFADTPRVYLVHGEDDAAGAFSALVEERLGLRAKRPVDGEVVEL